jgi:hypothetical protein
LRRMLHQLALMFGRRRNSFTEYLQRDHTPLWLA